MGAVDGGRGGHVSVGVCVLLGYPCSSGWLHNQLHAGTSTSWVQWALKRAGREGRRGKDEGNPRGVLRRVLFLGSFGAAPGICSRRPGWPRAHSAASLCVTDDSQFCLSVLFL